MIFSPRYPLVGLCLLESLQRGFHLALFEPAVRQMDARFIDVRRFVNDMLENPLGLFELAKGNTANTKQIQCIIVRIIVLEKFDIGIMRGLELTGKLKFHDLPKRKLGAGCDWTNWFIETSSDFGRPSGHANFMPRC